MSRKPDFNGDVGKVRAGNTIVWGSAAERVAPSFLDGDTAISGLGLGQPGYPILANVRN